MMTAAATPPSIAAIGECMLELSQAGPGWQLGHAGDTFNTLWAMRMLLPEARTDFVSAFGTDPFSDQQITFMADAGIGIAASPSLEGLSPGLYAITLDGAERSFTYWRKDAAARRLADDLPGLATSLSNRNLIYFSGITLAILAPPARKTLLKCIAVARAAGAIVAFDANYRARLWQDAAAARNAITEALSCVDIALPTFPDEQALFGDRDPSATAERLAGFGAREVVVKNGEAPAFVRTDGAEQTVPAVPAGTVVDTTGAGDAFNGGYLAARLRGAVPVAAVGRAHRVAAAAICVYGALAPAEALRRAFGSQPN